MRQNLLECIDIKIDDNLLKDAKIASYMANQSLPTDAGKIKPYAPKSFPDKAIIVQFQNGQIPIQIYLDTKNGECVNKEKMDKSRAYKVIRYK